MKQIGTISELVVFPIKSCAGISVEKAIVTSVGLALVENPKVLDRKWLVVDEKGSFLTQRQLPKMALIRPKVDGENLVLAAPNMPDLKVPIKTPENKVNCRVWDTHTFGFVYGGEIAQWLRKFLGKENIDLVSFGENQEAIKLASSADSKEAFNAKESDARLYADFSPFMFLSEASVHDLNAHLNDLKVTVKNFRPNVFLKDCEAFSEDKWTDFKIRDVNFHNVKHCTRCLLTTVDPNLGEKDKNQEPLKTLKSYRLDKDRYGVSPMFGINAATDAIGQDHVIAINDPIYGI